MPSRQRDASGAVIVVAVLWSLFDGAPSVASWIPLGPEGGPAGAIVSDPVHRDSLYAVNADSLWKTTDGGRSWTRYSVPLLEMRTMAISPSNFDVMYIGGDDGIARSTNGGSSWSLLGPLRSPANVVSVYDLAIDPGSPDVVYAAASNGLFLTTNGGGQWTSLADTLGDYSFSVVRLIPGNPSVLLGGTVGGTNTAPGGLFRSTNGGRDWLKISSSETGEFVKAVVVAELDRATFYLATEKGVFKSANGGASWTAASSGIEIADVALHRTFSPAIRSTRVCFMPAPRSAPS